MKILNIGLDVGSTTVKAVVMDNKKNILFSEYRRHFSNTKKTIEELLNEIIDKYNDCKYTLSMTGSGAIALAKFLNVNLRDSQKAINGLTNMFFSELIRKGQ